MPPEQFIHITRGENIARVMLDRPPLNVMNIAMMRALGDALESLGDVRFLVFSGAGPRGFSAGAEVSDHVPDRVAEMLGAFHRVFRLLWRGDWITVAAVHGCCLGGGCELAAACDFVLAEQGAHFGQPEIKLGCFPPVALILLPRLVGPRAASDLILTGKSIPAREALEIGLITRVVPEGHLQTAADLLIEKLQDLSSAALALTRRAMLRTSGQDFEAALHEAEALYLNQLMKTADASEGIQAFLEKRVPAWQGR